MSDLISIIIPVYNAEKYIERCVTSVLNQTYQHLEIIIVNDGSTDRSSVICNDLMLRDNRVKVIHTNNNGVSEARNRGINAAKGVYIGFVDSDDYIDKDMYELLHSLAVDNFADIAICDFYGNNNKLSLDSKLIFDREQAIKELLMGGVFQGQLWNKLFRNDSIKDNMLKKDFNNREDLIYVYEVMCGIEKVVFCSIAKYHYMKRDGSLSDTKLNVNSMINACAATDYLILRVENEFPNALFHICENRFKLSLFYLDRIIIYSMEDKRFIQDLKQYVKAFITNQKFRKQISNKNILKADFLVKYFWVYCLFLPYLKSSKRMLRKLKNK